MPRHSKNNTASSVFTYHEAKSLDYGTKKQRIGRDSFRNYNACFLCLQTARDPVACPHGHLACRECMYESILQQKQNIKREQKLLERKLAELQEKKKKEEEDAKNVLLDEFERPWARRLPTTVSTESSEKGSPQSSHGEEVPKAGTKRKFELSAEALADIAQKDVERASNKLAEEKAKSNNDKLPSFWLPTMTPEAEKQFKDELKAVQTQTMCRAAKDEHPVSLKTLITVKFQTENGETDKNVCPSCVKSMSNSMKLFLMRPCGHVVCGNCTDMFVRKSKQCYVCETKLKSKDIIDMRPEGTGFASGSVSALAEKTGIAFQC